MATRVAESAVVTAKIGAVWDLVRPLTFAYLNKRVTGVALDADGQAVGGTRSVTYADGTVQRLRLAAVSDAQRYVAWDVVESVPAISVLSVTHHVRCFRVTDDDTTYVEWETLFSKDVSAAVLEDARYKQREHFAAIQAAIGKPVAAAAATAAAAAPAAAAGDRKDEKAAPAKAAAPAVSLFEWERPKREMLEDAGKTLELAAPLAANPTGFTALRLSGHSLSPAAATALAPVLARTNALTTVDISDVIVGRATPDVVAALTTVTTALATANTAITEVNVSDNALGLAGVQACAPLLARGTAAARLQVLKFNNNGLEGDAADFITKSVLGGGKPTALRHFEIHNNCLTDAGAIGLAPLFAASPLLERIRFTTTRLGSDGGDALVKSLVDCGSRAFVAIELADNSIGEDAGEVFATKVLPHQSKLQVLNIADTGFGKKAVGLVLDALATTAPDLTALDLSNLELDGKLVARVADLLARKPKLTRLGLEGNDFGNKGALAVAKALADACPGLTDLNLSGNGLTSAAVGPILDALKNKPHLKRLSLNSNRFDKKGLAALRAAVAAQAAWGPKTLDTLSENDNDDDDDDDDAAADKLAGGVAKMAINK